MMRNFLFKFAICTLQFAICNAAFAQWIEVSPTGFTRDGKPFYTWGFNYDRNGDSKLLEDHWIERWPEISGDFAEMKQLGANVVRIHLQTAKFMDSPDRPNEENLKQLSKLVDLAEKNGLYLDLTGLGCYRKEDLPPWFNALSEQDRWHVQANFWRSIANVCANRSAVLAYDLINEPIVPGDKPETEWLAGNLGGFWFCQRICLDLKGRDRIDVARDWARKMIAAIRENDTRHPITIGLLPMTGAFPIDKLTKDLDYVSIHIYPEKGKVPQAIAILDQFHKVCDKPTVIEETFPLACGADDLKKFIVQARPKTTGCIGFYWGKTPAEIRAEKKPSMVDAFVLSWLDLFQELTPR
jgi:hypothetical protein